MKRSPDLGARLRGAGFALQHGELVIGHIDGCFTYPLPSDIVLHAAAPESGAKAEVKPPRRCGDCLPNERCGPCFSRERAIGALAEEAFPLLAYDANQFPRMLRQSDPAEGCLLEFMRLAEGPPTGFLEFARRRGVIGFCYHSQPATHLRGCWRLGDWHGELIGVLGGRWDITAWEPLALWHRYSRQVRAILLAAARLQTGRLLSEADWREITVLSPNFDYVEPIRHGDFEQFYRPLLYAPIGEQQAALAHVASRWFGYAGLEAVLQWPTEELSARATLASPAFGSLRAWGGLIGVLAVQLGLTLTSPQGVYQCDDCGLPYSPEGRRPQAGRNHYCASCRDSGAYHHAKRQWWHRNRARSPR